MQLKQKIYDAVSFGFKENPENRYLAMAVMLLDVGYVYDLWTLEDLQALKNLGYGYTFFDPGFAAKVAAERPDLFIKITGIKLDSDLNRMIFANMVARRLH